MNLQIGKSPLPYAGIREIKQDTLLDDNLKAQLAEDGFDEIIFQKGEQVFIAYQRDMDLSALQLNLDNTLPVEEAGQLSVDGEAVQLLWKDDENRSAGSTLSTLAQSAVQGAGKLMQNPYGRAASIGFASGLVLAVADRNLDTRYDYFQIKPGRKFGRNYQFVPFRSMPALPNHPRGMMLGPNNLTQFRLHRALSVGAPVGAATVGLKAGLEDKVSLTTPLLGLGAAAGGFVAGGLVGTLGDQLVKQAVRNPKTSLAVAGVALAAVGADLAISRMNAPEAQAPSTAVIDRISAP